MIPLGLVGYPQLLAGYPQVEPSKANGEIHNRPTIARTKGKKFYLCMMQLKFTSC